MTNSWQNPANLRAALLMLVSAQGCQPGQPADQNARGTPAPSTSAQLPRPSTSARALAPAPAPSASGPVRAQVCPSRMRPVPGGEFWVGGTFNDDEGPEFLAQVFDFCLDETEVTLQSYHECVTAGACTRAGKDRVTCSESRAAARANHPVNCVDFRQAESYCRWRQARLPSEVEWEYAARGGSKYYDYSWGNEGPDGHACWKQGSACAVKSFAPGAFGLYDMTGNVWEWTSDWYGPYPWSRLEGHARVYRGGSWSRRFVKWMRPQLRNRYPEWESGSHLGFRCAATPPNVACSRDPEHPDRCLRVVKDVRCGKGKSFNGVRCAAPGEPHCSEGFEERAGHGCVHAGAQAGTEVLKNAADTQGVVGQRSPEFDEDCASNYSGRPRAFRYTGGDHHGRNAVSRKVGCKNRDVGAGWNSCCCP